jgi:murein DD-endopeptidase MepM/ murein hydrolase activator NlpD
VFAVDGVPDNIPGEENRYFISGNAVLLEHDGFWAEYNHLQLRSVRVHEGDAVKRGDVIGRCGNSGSTSQPHLHLQLQDGPRLETAWGVEGVFENVKLTRDGKEQTIAAYTFLKGDRLHAGR